MFSLIESTPGADLVESFDHPLVPVAEHVQPLHLPLPEDLWRHILSSEDRMEKDGKRKYHTLHFKIQIIPNETK